METKVPLSEEGCRKYALGVLADFEDYRRRGVTKWVEPVVLNLRPRVRTILAEIMPIDLYIWVGAVSPQAHSMLRESLDPAKQV